ncbi:MAG: hypothetical protein GEV10_14800 [Streptosporangiales bacterium]|nr:hypothetical protein [Streptosporangiales bacterium]
MIIRAGGMIWGMSMGALAWVTRRSGVFWLAVVAAGFAVTQVALIPLDVFQSWDEVVYVSQFSQHAPDLTPSPHRAPGMAFLLAPVTAVTSSFTVIRGYLTVVSALGLFLAFRPWLAVDARVAPLAALLFAFSSEVLLIAHLALPNLYTALTAVATVAFFVRAVEGAGEWRALVGVAGSLGLMSLVRPTDAVFLAVPLFAACVVVRRWRRVGPPVAVLAGLGIGGVAWLVEALVRFGGPVTRLAGMQTITDAGSDPLVSQWAASIAAQAATAPLPTLALGVGWAAAVVVTVAVVRGVCGGWPRPVWVLTLVASAGLILPYFLLLSYASDRYLLPAQCVLVVVAAAALVRLVRSSVGSRRNVVAGAAAIAVLLYTGVQVVAAFDRAPGSLAVRQARQGYAERIGEHGISPPCVVSGYQAPALAYALGCEAGDNLSALASANWQREFRRDQRRAQREDARFVTVLFGERPPDGVAGWPRIRLNEEAPIYAYFAPSRP